MSSSTFQATTSSAVPEPSTVMLLATGWQDSVSRRA
ncbi:PEP-CTERM sorting domain-containing protein [Gemmatimonas sp.]